MYYTANLIPSTVQYVQFKALMITAALLQLDSVLYLITSNNVSPRADVLFISVASQLAPTFISTFQHNLISILSGIDEPSGNDTAQ